VVAVWVVNQFTNEHFTVHMRQKGEKPFYALVVLLEA
jgi:hypothetical protein